MFFFSWFVIKIARKLTQNESKIDNDEKTKNDANQTKSNTDKESPSILRVLALNKPEWYYIVIGCLGGIVSGAANPVFSIIFA